MKKVVFIPIAFLFLSIFGCEKQKWKEPTEVSAVFEIERSSDNYSYLEFTNAQLVLRSFVFDGLRVQADDVYFESEFEGGLLVDFNSSQPNSDLIFEIPQGTYTTIRIDLEVEESDEKKLILEGVYTNTSGQELPLRLEYAMLEFYDEIALTSSGGQEIDLVSGAPSVITILFDPFHWFSSISISQLDNATTTNINGVQTLLVNEDVNSDLLDLINEKIANKVDITFE